MSIGGNAILWPGVVTSLKVLCDFSLFTRQGVIELLLFVRHCGDGCT